MHSSPKCISNKQAYYVCINTSCHQKCSFICQQSKKCICDKIHEGCEKISWGFLLNKFTHKKTIHDSLLNQFQTKLQLFFSNAHKSLTKLQNQYKTWKQNFGYTKIQQDFRNRIRFNNFTLFQSKNFAQIHKQLKKQSYIKISTQSIQKLNKLEIEFTKLIEKVSITYQQINVIKKNCEQWKKYSFPLTFFRNASQFNEWMNSLGVSRSEYKNLKKVTAKSKSFGFLQMLVSSLDKCNRKSFNNNLVIFQEQY